MNKKIEYVITTKVIQQISPDDWEVVHKSLKVTDETTIGQIREWYCRMHLPYAEGNKADNIKMEGVTLNQLHAGV